MTHLQAGVLIVDVTVIAAVMFVDFLRGYRGHGPR